MHIPQNWEKSITMYYMHAMRMLYKHDKVQYIISDNCMKYALQ